MSTILEDVKMSLGDMTLLLGEEFDSQILQFVEMSVLPLTQVGCITAEDFDIDKSTEWEDIINQPPDNRQDKYISLTSIRSAVKTYVQLQVRILFDPPVSTVVNIMEDKCRELLWRIELAYHEKSD